MRITKWQMSLAGMLLVAAVALSVWQEMRLNELKADNQRLCSLLTNTTALHAERQRLRGPSDDSELNHLRTDQTQLQGEIVRLRGRLSESMAKVGAMTQAMNTASTSASTDSSTNSMVQSMGNLVKGTSEMQIMGKLSPMKARLNLTPEQEQAVRDILRQQINQSTEVAQKMFSGKMTRDEMMAMQKSAPNTEEQIKALLSPEQLTAYKEYKQEESVSNARLVANAELLQMQTPLGLTQDQQDQVYKALYEYTVNQLSGKLAQPPKSNGDLTAAMQWQVDQKIKALESILTPEQLQNYRQIQENQTKAIAGMMSSETTKPAP